MYDSNGYEIVENKPKKERTFASIAKEFRTALGKEIRTHQGQTYFYDGCRYIEQPNLDALVRRFLVQKGYNHSNSYLANVVGTIRHMALVPNVQHKAMPFHLDRPDSRFLSFKNGLLCVDDWLKGETTLLPHTDRFISTGVGGGPQSLDSCWG